jgi:hypothetical protein
MMFQKHVDEQLYTWVKCQRRKDRESKLSKERRDALSEIGFQWSSPAAAPAPVPPQRSPKTPKRRKTARSKTELTTPPVSATNGVADYRPKQVPKFEDDGVTCFTETYLTVYALDLNLMIDGLEDGTMDVQTAIEGLKKMARRT